MGKKSIQEIIFGPPSQPGERWSDSGCIPLYLLDLVLFSLVSPNLICGSFINYYYYYRYDMSKWPGLGCLAFVAAIVLFQDIPRHSK